MDASNVTVKEEPPETADLFTAMDSLLHDVEENGIEMKTFVFDTGDGPPQLMPEASSEPNEVSGSSQSRASNTHAPLVYRIHRRQEQRVDEEFNPMELRGRLNHCNGHRMQATHVMPGRILFWRCCKHALLQCAGSAVSRSPHARLVERTPHNHELDEVQQKVLEIFRAYDAIPQEHALASSQTTSSSSTKIQRSGHCQESSLLATTSQSSSGSADLFHKMRTYRLPSERCPGRYALCEGHRMVSTVRKNNGDIVWKCVHANSLKCRGTATSPKDNEEEPTVTKPHSHPPLILGPKQKIPTGIDKSTLLLSASASPSEASTPIDISRMSRKQSSTRGRIALCNNYYMRESYTTKEGVTTWYCCKMLSQTCRAMAESSAENPELVQKRPHSHAPASLYGKPRGRPTKHRGGPLSTADKTEKRAMAHSWEVPEAKETESTGQSDSESTSSSDYTDSDDFSDPEFKPVEGKAFGLRDTPKVQRSRDLLRCDKHAMVEGYPMRCQTAASSGVSYWKCRRQGTSNCKDFAISNLDGSIFRMTHQHNHPPGEVDIHLFYSFERFLQTYGLLRCRERWKPIGGDSKPPGRPRKHHDKSTSKKNFDLLKCDTFATVDGYLMRCMYVAARSGKSWWFCRVHGRFKCRGSATSDLYGREFLTVCAYNHPPASDGLRSLKVEPEEQRYEAESNALAEANGVGEAYVDLRCNDSLMDHDY